MTYHYYLTYTSGDAGDVYLQRSKLDQDDYSNMASMGIYPPPTGYKYSTTDVIVNPIIDNSQCEYWVVVELPVSKSGDDQQMWNCGVVISYIPPTTFSGVLTIPAAAFTPYRDGYNYENDGRYIFTYAGSTDIAYVAPVELPEGATVTSMTFHYYDANPSYLVSAHLFYRYVDGSVAEEMAYADSISGGGWSSDTDTSITGPLIDNGYYYYWIEWDIPAYADLKGCAVVINYTLDLPPFLWGFP